MNTCAIGGNDLWIAGDVLSIDASLVTNKFREFSRIDDLRLENRVEQELRNDYNVIPQTVTIRIRSLSPEKSDGLRV